MILLAQAFQKSGGRLDIRVATRVFFLWMLVIGSLQCRRAPPRRRLQGAGHHFGDRVVAISLLLRIAVGRDGLVLSIFDSSCLFMYQPFAAWLMQISMGHVPDML